MLFFVSHSWNRVNDCSNNSQSALIDVLLKTIMSEKIGEGMDPSRMKKYHEGWIQHQADGKKVCPFLHFLLLDFVQAMCHGVFHSTVSYE